MVPYAIPIAHLLSNGNYLNHLQLKQTLDIESSLKKLLYIHMDREK